MPGPGFYGLGAAAPFLAVAWQMAENTARRQPLPRGLKMFQRVKRASAIARRMKKVRHNHIIPGSSYAHEPARISSVKLQGRLASGREIVRLELRHHCEHLRHQFNAVAFEARVKARRAKGNPGAESQKQRPSGRWMEKQRDMGVAI